MRITITLKKQLADNLKRVARNEGQSVSGFVADAIETYLLEKKRKTMGKKVLDMAGKVYVSEEVFDVLDEWRNDDRS